MTRHTRTSWALSDARLSRSRDDGAVFGFERPEGEPHWIPGTCIVLAIPAMFVAAAIMGGVL